jgi:hypothetical protein
MAALERISLSVSVEAFRVELMRDLVIEVKCYSLFRIGDFLFIGFLV